MLGACELLVGMRLHSILFACMTGTPFVALGSTPRCRSKPACSIRRRRSCRSGALAARSCARRWRGSGAGARTGPAGPDARGGDAGRAGRNDELAGALLDAAPRPLPRRLRHRLLGVLREREELRLAGTPAEALRAGGWPPALGSSSTFSR